MTPPRNDTESGRSRRPPATTPEARENQMIALAHDVAEKQMREGTASSATILHYLKLGSSRERLEQEKLRSDNQLSKARVENMATSANSEALAAKAIAAFRSYSGQDPEDGEQ